MKLLQGRHGKLGQDRIVLALAVLLFAAFAITLPGFLQTANLLSLLRSVSVLGVLGIAMVIVVIGRGIDLSLVANMAIGVAWAFQLANTGHSLAASVTLGLLFMLAMSAITGILIAYAEIPPLFATLAMATFIYGFGRAHMILGIDVVYLPQDVGALTEVGQGFILGIPTPVLIFGIVAFLVFTFLRFTKYGRFVYAMGDNYQAARIGGIAVRPMLVLQYTLAGTLAFIAGMVTATSVGAMNTRIVTSNMIYDVILVVVLGGVGLSGGQGGVRNVLVGTLLIGILLNGMTIMDIQYTVQNLIKSVILLVAIIVDSLLNPRDEQTAQQGDI
jgi:ribose transport system permease protein